MLQQNLYMFILTELSFSLLKFCSFTHSKPVSLSFYVEQEEDVLKNLGTFLLNEQKSIFFPQKK